jgi:hypothetical protein
MTLLVSLRDGGGSPRRRRHLASGDLGEGTRRPVVERAVRTLRVVVDAKELDLDARSRQRREALLREALVAERPLMTNLKPFLF